MLELADNALRGDDEYQGLVAMDAPTGTLLGLALYGTVAGAVRATKVHLLSASNQSVADLLAAAVMDAISSARARIAVAEVPDDLAFGVMRSALRTVGFDEEGHVADWFADGVGLRLLTARLP